LKKLNFTSFFFFNSFLLVKFKEKENYILLPPFFHKTQKSLSFQAEFHHPLRGNFTPKKYFEVLKKKPNNSF